MSVDDLTFILKGQATYITDDGEFTVGENEAIYVKSGSKRVAYTDGMECVAFNFVNTQFQISNTCRKFVFYQDYEFTNIIEQIEKSWNKSDGIQQMKCTGYLLTLISSIIAENRDKTVNPYVRQMKEYILTNLDKTIKMEDVADKCKLNPIYCGNLFIKEMGVSAITYSNSIKLKKAKDMLIYSDENISEIALDLGFENLYYFSRLFKQKVGISPKNYRIEKRKLLK